MPRGEQLATQTGEYLADIRTQADATRFRTQLMSQALSEQRSASAEVAAGAERINSMAEDVSEVLRDPAHTAHYLDEVARHLRADATSGSSTRRA